MKSKIALLGLLVIAVVLVSGCAQKVGTKPTDTATPTQTPVATPTTTPLPSPTPTDILESGLQASDELEGDVLDEDLDDFDSYLAEVGNNLPGPVL